MTTAIAATGPSIREQSVEPTTPLVFVDGRPDPDIAVVNATMFRPMDRREATVHLADRWLSSNASLHHSEVTITVPHALTDGEVRWDVLMSGQLFEADRTQSSGREINERVLLDRLAVLLDEPIELLGPWVSDELTLAEVLERLAARLDAELVLACDTSLLSSAVSSSSPLRDTIAARLGPVLSDLALTLEQRIAFDAQQVRRTLWLVPASHGRRVSLPWPDGDGRGGSVVSVVVDREARPPRAWVAQGDRPIVEDTFTLQPGWDPSLEGQPDSDYGRLTSSDFSRFGSTYRDWVLNEDGHYSDAPYNLDQPFDVGALFGQPGTIDVPLRLGSCLTRSSAGRRISAIIESSTDSGATWSAYPGQAQVMNDRAGVQLIDDVLPTAILSAAKAGTLRVRVTASITSPLPIEAKRWDGNPFAGPAPTRVIDISDNFRWQFVMPSSIHHEAIESGLLEADTADDRLALRAKLRVFVDQQPGPTVTARLDLAGAWSAFRPGDCVRDALGRGIALDGTPSSFATREARINRIDLSFGVFNASPRTRLRLD